MEEAKADALATKEKQGKIGSASLFTLNARLLSALAEVWPSPKRQEIARFDAVPGSAAYARAYAVNQYMRKVRAGLAPYLDIPILWGKEVLEIGCGHGGITCYLASIGPRRVVGIDINVENLGFAQELLQRFEHQRGVKASNVEFLKMNAHALDVPDASFDVVVADNLFEHVSDPQQVLRESKRVLRPGGVLIIPLFSSIKSKYGPHLKHGLKLPWVNLFFSEQTIIGAMQRRAQRHPDLHDLYPGIANSPTRLRDLRRYKDLNDITYGAFKDMARASGFRIEQFHVHATLPGKVLRRLLPPLKETRTLDVLSTGASALLRAQ